MSEDIEIKKIIENFDQFRSKSDRMSWHRYFFDLCHLVSQRSPDAQTRHGAVLVDHDNRVVSTGYNGFPGGGPDHLLPNTRPAKYPYIIHAEMNALLAARCDLRGCSLYVTGIPCKSCLLHVIGAGIKKIYFGPIPHVEDVDSTVVRSVLVRLYGIELWTHEANNKNVLVRVWPKI
jgi:dCMP deaminase